MPLYKVCMALFNTFFVITSFCSIYNFVTMLCKDVTISITICMLLFVAMFILQGSLMYILSTSEPIRNTYTDEYGNTTIISERENPNYPGDTIYNMAKSVYLLLPQGPASEIANNNTEYLYKIPIYTIIFVFVINLSGMWLFTRKELK